MSRIGKLPVIIPEGIQVDIKENLIEVSKGKNKMSLNIPFGISLKKEDNIIEISRINDEKRYRALHGTIRALLNNMVVGLTKGFSKKLELRGVGYKAQVKGKTLVLNLGYSHLIEYTIPDSIEITMEGNTKLEIKGYDKQLVGQVASEIRKFRKPEPYKGKGVRYENEYILMKAGKRSK